MEKYIKELWIGRGDKYWHWEIKGYAEDDYVGKIEACDDFMEELKNIKDFYKRLLEKGKVNES